MQDLNICQFCSGKARIINQQSVIIYKHCKSCERFNAKIKRSAAFVVDKQSQKIVGYIFSVNDNVKGTSKYIQMFYPFKVESPCIQIFDEEDPFPDRITWEHFEFDFNSDLSLLDQAWMLLEKLKTEGYPGDYQELISVVPPPTKNNYEETIKLFRREVVKAMRLRNFR